MHIAKGRSALWNVCTDSCSEEDNIFVVPFVYSFFILIVNILTSSDMHHVLVLY